MPASAGVRVMYMSTLTFTLAMQAVHVNAAASHTSSSSQDRPWGAVRPTPHPGCHEVSTSFGDHMVLQRAPEKAVVYGSVCGGLASASTVSVSIDGQAPTTVAIAKGARSWQVQVPAQPGGLTPHTLTIRGGAFSATLRDVLFGESILCSGQSNMCFSLNQMTGARDEIALADEPRFRNIRLFTVTPGYDAKGPHSDVQVMQPWSVANSSTVGDGGRGTPFSTFSAACWVQGRHLFDRLGGNVPVGLLTSAVGGTRIHCWSSADALKECPQFLPPGQNSSGSDSDLWNTMIAPLLPMRFKFMVWLQSESDVCASDDKCIPQRGATYYACAIKAMVRDWRAKFNLALPFLWVQISPWEGHEAATSSYQLPAMRLAQMAANELPLTAVATAVDLGPPANAHGWDSGDEHGLDPWGNVHFRNKGPLGPRLSAAAMNVVYGARWPYKGPEAASAAATAVALPAAVAGVCGGAPAPRTAAGVAVSFKADTLGGGLKAVARECPYIVLKANGNQTELDCPKSIDDCIAKCGWWDIELGAGNWHRNATATISGDTVVIAATDARGCPLAATVAPTAVRYLYADWPVATLYNNDGFPALPFVLNVTGRTDSTA